MICWTVYDSVFRRSRLDEVTGDVLDVGRLGDKYKASTDLRRAEEHDRTRRKDNNPARWPGRPSGDQNPSVSRSNQLMRPRRNRPKGQ